MDIFLFSFFHFHVEILCIFNFIGVLNITISYISKIRVDHSCSRSNCMLPFHIFQRSRLFLVQLYYSISYISKIKVLGSILLVNPNLKIADCICEHCCHFLIVFFEWFSNQNLLPWSLFCIGSIRIMENHLSLFENALSTL